MDRNEQKQTEKDRTDKTDSEVKFSQVNLSLAKFVQFHPVLGKFNQV